MRVTMLAAFAMAAAPGLLSAQARNTSTRPETTFVKGSVTGEIPTGNYTITGSTTSYYTIPATSMTPSSDMSSTSSVSTSPDMSTSAMSTTTETPPAKPTLDRKVSHGVGEAAGEVSKTGKKAAHGIKEAASDVKKKVTGKP